MINLNSEKVIFAAIAGATLILFVGGTVFIGNQTKVDSKRLNESASVALMGEEIPSQGGTHVARGMSHPEYNSNPPTSGWHWGDGVAGAGIHDEEVPDELLIHSLEHGAVIVSYRKDLSQEDVEKIKAAFNKAKGKKIIVPRTNLDIPVALTSWGRLLKLNEIDDQAIIDFIQANSDHGPEKVNYY